jgi:hypothetical protein
MSGQIAANSAINRAADGVLSQFPGGQTEVSFIPIYQGISTVYDSLRDFKCRGFDVVDFMPVKRAPADLLMMGMDCILPRGAHMARGAQV